MALVRTLDVDTLGAIQNRNAVVPRDFIVFHAKNRDTGVESLRCFWTEVETVAVEVRTETGVNTSYDFTGGAIEKVDPIPMRIGLTIQNTQIILNPLHTEVKNLIRLDEPRGAAVEIYRGYYDPDTFLLVARPRVRYLGTVNGAPIITPAVGGAATATIKLVGSTRELTFVNHAMKSDAEQRKRSDDRFRRYAGKVRGWPIYWGKSK
jgi:hypothetical protein